LLLWAVPAPIPMLIDGLGIERFGILTLGWVVLGYFHVFDLGLSRATTKLVADCLASGSTRRMPDFVWTAAAMQVVLGLVGGAALASGAPLLAGRVFEIPAGLIAEARLTFLVLAATTPLVLVTGAFQGALAGGQRFDLINAVRIPFSSGNYLLPLAGMALGWSLPGIVMLLAISRLAALIAHLWLCVRVFPELLEPVSWPWQSARELLAFGVWVTVSGAVGPILMYLDRFMLGSLLSVEAVGYYAAPSELVMRLMIIPGALAATLFPALSSVQVQGDSARAKLLIVRSTKYLVMSSGLASLVLVVYARDILVLWLGADLAEESTTVLRILAVGVLVNSLAHIPYAILHAHGRPDLPAKFHLVELPLHAALVAALIAMWGTAGAAAAWTIRSILDAGLLFAAARRVAQFSLSGVHRSGLREVLATLTILGGCLALAHGALPTPLGGVIFGIVLVGLAVAVMLRWGLDDQERAFVDHWLRSIRGIAAARR
jgi:O-antigen/teichoic acid export membrane protein